MPTRSHRLAPLVGLLVAGCMKTATVRTYELPHGNAGKDPAGEEVRFEAGKAPLEIRIANLDGLEVYRHGFASGLVVAAPALDPRRYMLPDSLVYSPSFFNGRDVSFGLPDRPYEVIGELSVKLELAMATGAPGIPDNSHNPVVAQSVDLDRAAGNGAPYVMVRPYNWKKVLKQTHELCGEAGADALIECHVGKGTNAFWHPPTSTWVPVFGPKGTIIGGYNAVNPAFTQLSDWQLSGLLVRWKN
jgi:hypothetical protein